MKIIAIFLLSAMICLSQTREPVQQKLELKGSLTYLSDTIAPFKLDKYLIFWQWGGSRKMTKSLLVNQANVVTYWGLHASDYADSISLFVQSSYNITVNGTNYIGNLWSHCGYDNSIMFTKSLQYDPSLFIDSNNIYKLNIRPDDNQKCVFGFLRKVGTSSRNFNDSIYRWVIGSATAANTVVLENPWPSNLLTYKEGSEQIIYTPRDTTSADTLRIQQTALLNIDINNNFSGKRYYLSINLRRGQGNLGQTDTQVLKIEVPFVYNNNGIMTDGMAVFDSIPNDTIGRYYSLPKNRGNVCKLKGAGISGSNSIIITKKMLPPTSIDNSDITISGFIDFSKHITNNYPLKEKDVAGSAANGRIEDLKIKVTYLGGGSIAIKDIKFETVNARTMFHSYYDTLIMAGVQKDIKMIEDTAYSNRGITIGRFATHVEGSPIHWGSERYFNKLIGDLSTGERGIYLPLHYNHYVGVVDAWYGTNQLAANVSVPYSRKKYDNELTTSQKTLGLINGYNGYHDSAADKSSYETYLAFYNYSNSTFYSLPITYFLEHSNLSDTNNLAAYVGSMSYGANNWRISSLANWEGYLYRNYLQPINQGLIFSNIKWWSQEFTLNAIDTLNGSPYKFFQTDRPYTAEELRQHCMTSLILACKGIGYDGPDTYSGNRIYTRMYDFLNIQAEKRDSLERLSDIDFLNSELAGSDFFRDSNEICNLNAHIYPLDTIGKYLDRPAKKIYYGRRSQRMELLKIHQYIRNIEDTLKNFRLQCWLAKGYKRWYSQSPDLTSYELGKYIDTNDIRTQEIYSGQPEGTSQWRYQDSSFYDLTVLKDVSTSANPDVFYIGASNRRTSPLILENDTLRFYTGSEFDDRCDSGGLKLDGVFEDSTYWRDKYWRKEGCRIITLPFDYKDTLNPNQYCLLKVQELKAYDSVLSSDPWWKKDKFNRYIDTIIGMDNDLAVKFQPGDSKIFRIEIIRPQTQTGNLDFSNQTKLVSHPIINSNGTLNDSLIMYHLTYSKKVPKAGNPSIIQNRIYYVGSEPIKKDVASNENIVWRQPIDLSNNIRYTGNQVRYLNSDPNYFDDCLYPSIVARKAGNNLKVYVVFSVAKMDTLTCGSYSCDNDSTCYDLINPIAEAILTYTVSAYPPLISKNIIVPRVSGYLQSNYPEVNGTPIIAATNNYNYYAWSDLYCGIGVNYKLPNDSLFRPSTTKYLKYDSMGTISSTLHPSFDNYNEPVYSSNACPLVWYEYIDFLNLPGQPGTSYYVPRRIIYTELYINQNNIYNILPNLPSGYPVQNNCLKISDNSNENVMPVVLRKWNIPNGPFSPLEYYDQIFWESKKYFSTPNEKSDLNYRALYSDYWVGNGSLTSTKYITTFLNILGGSQSENLLQPNITTGDSRFGYHSLNYPNNLTNSFNILNFKDYYAPSSSNQILQMDYTSHSLFSQGNILRLGIPFLKVAEGNLSHLSKNWDYNRNSDNKMWRNRRIMESTNLIDSLSNKSLAPNARYFYRGADDDKVSEAFVGFIESYDRRFKYMINIPKVDENPIGLILPYQEFTDSVGYTDYIEVPTDSIYSEWFHVQDVATLNYKLIFADTILSNLYVQKQSTGDLIEIPRPEDFESDMCFMVYLLINGENDNYRLLLIKNAPKLVYEERLYVGNVDVQATFYAKGNSSQSKFIDLGGKKVNETNNIEITAYPNPSSDILYFTANLPATEYLNKRYVKSKINYTLTNSIGKVVTKKEGYPGDVIQFNTSELPNGMYIIQALTDIYNSNHYKNLNGYKSIIIRH